MCWKTSLLHTKFFHFIHQSMMHAGKRCIALPSEQSFPFMALKGHNQVTHWELEAESFQDMMEKMCQQAKTCRRRRRVACDHLPVLEKNKCKGEIIGTFWDAVRGHRWQQPRERKCIYRLRHAKVEVRIGWGVALLPGCPNPESLGRTAEVCSSASQKGLKPLGFAHMNI